MSIKRANVHKVLGCGQRSEHLDSHHYCNDLDACLSLRAGYQAWLTQPKLIDFLQVIRRFRQSLVPHVLAISPITLEAA